MGEGAEPHVDWDSVSPCFVLTPHTYEGGELLLGANNTKYPLREGQVLGGSWQRWPHCNGDVKASNRCSFVAYFDYRFLNENYWHR